MKYSVLPVFLALVCVAGCAPSESSDLPADAVIDAPLERRWSPFAPLPRFVIDERRACPEAAVEAAFSLWWDAGVELQWEVGACPETMIEGVICIHTDDSPSMAAARRLGSASWWTREEAPFYTFLGDIAVRSECDAAVIAHEVGHILGLGHSDHPEHTMYRHSPRMHISPAEAAQVRLSRVLPTDKMFRDTGKSVSNRHHSVD